MSWDSDGAKASTDSFEQLAALRSQLEAMDERLQSMFATAADLIAADDIGGVLARITARAAVEVRAPRHPTDASSADSLLRVADAAMFDAKREQRAAAPSSLAGR